MPIFNNALAGAAGQTGGATTPTDYQVDRSLRFNSADSSSLSTTIPAITTFSFSWWYKHVSLTRNDIFVTDSSYGFFFYQHTDGSFRLNNNTTNLFISNGVYRDPGAWMHCLLTNDGTTLKFYVNGVLDKAQTVGTLLNAGGLYIGRDRASANNYGNFYMAEVNFVDGQALNPTDFAEYDSNNNWNPKAYAGTYGTNGFKLNFSDNSSNEALGYDQSVATPDPNPDGGMDVVTWTGNGSTQTISGLGFQPDFVWIKARSAAYDHYLQDVVRGVTKTLEANQTGAETTNADGVTEFTSDGFKLGAGTGNTAPNVSNVNYVGWSWKAGGAASLNESGSINSQVSANTDYGFSVVSYTGTGSNATVGHGLSSAPKWVLYKSRGDGNDWMVYHTSMGATKSMLLNSDGAEASRSDTFNDTDPTSSVLHIGTSATTNNTNSAGMIAYCWSEVSGFSKFGSYTGNGSTNGPTVTTGFKPRFILVKNIDTAARWIIWDTERDDETLDKGLSPNLSNAEITSFNAQILSNGFQITDVEDTLNKSGDTFIYAAFADRPGNNFDVNNLVATAGADGAEGFDVVTYSGTGSTQSISGLKFQPDLVWIKLRNAGGYSHKLVDSVRGETKSLVSNNTNAELTEANGLTSFNSDGFSLGSQEAYNKNGNTFVAWSWKAGGTAVSNNSGSIPATVSANNTHGFSIVKYEGTGSNGTVAHGLSTAPKFFFGRNIDDTSGSRDWIIYHESIGNTGRLKFTTGNTSTSSTFFQNTSPSDSLISIGTSGDINKDNDDYILYCWSEVPGFSKFGSYSGNGSTQKLNFGFKPAFVIIKRYDSSTGGNWWMFDDKRVSGTGEFAQKAETSEDDDAAYNYFSFDDDGITLTTGNSLNGSGRSYIYMAFAGTPDSSVIDSLIDTPTNADADSGNNIGNYCTLNPLAKGAATSLSNGNLHYVGGAANQTLGTIGMSSGKWYWEDHKISGTYGATGIALADAPLNNHAGQGNSWAYNKNGNKWHNGSQSSYGATWDSGDTIGIAFDADAGTLVFYKNGVSQGTAYTGLTNGPYFVTGADNSVTGYFNFGASGSFKYAPPAGHKALCTQNLDPPTIADGSTVFDVVKYDGTGSTQAISGLGFKPDLVWIKNRASANYGHRLVDSVRESTKYLMSHSTGQEGTDSNGVTAFNSDGFDLGSSGDFNVNNNAFVGWAWDAGTTTDTNNTDGSITPTGVRANASAGFSIISYTATGSTESVGHGLNDTPALTILKNRDAAENWLVYTQAIDGSLDILSLNTTGTKSDSSNSAPTSSVVYLAGTNNQKYIAYCFAPVEGYSAFGSYTGNGNANGPFVYTGFRPAFILIKGSSFTSNWFIQDIERDGYNVNDGVALRPNLANAEDGTTTYNLDILSNGFKLRTSAADANTNGATFVWAAFAEHPFKTARAR